MTLTVLANFAGETETVGVLCLAVTITSSRKTLALDTLWTGSWTGLVTVYTISRVTVTTRGEGGLTLTVLANFSSRTETVWVLILTVTVTASFQTPALNTLRFNCWTLRVCLRSPSWVTITARGKLGGTSRTGQAGGGVRYTDLLDDAEVASLRV